MSSLKKFKVGRLLQRLRFYQKHILKNPVVKYQRKNPKSIPIFIISYNQLDNLRNLIEYLSSRGYSNLNIVDNASNYPPLLDYLEKIRDEFRVFKMDKNYGYRVFWLKKSTFEEKLKGYYAITDPDILPHKDCPVDFMHVFLQILESYSGIDKVGFGLRIDDIPETNPRKNEILKWEQKFWKNPTPCGNFYADIDTTFALYRPGHNHISYKGIRTKKPYLARHMGWYIDPANLSENESFYQATAGSSHFWNTRE